MKKFIIAAAAVILAAFVWHTAYYRLGLYIDIHPNAPAEAFMTVEGKEIYIEKDGVKSLLRCGVLIWAVVCPESGPQILL